MSLSKTAVLTVATLLMLGSAQTIAIASTAGDDVVEQSGKPCKTYVRGRCVR